MPHSTTLLATGFVSDQPAEGTVFPSAGGNSANPEVQAVYWRCIVALFASARFSNPGQRLALFTNAPPPRVDGEEMADVLAGYEVEIHTVPLQARLAPGTTQSWGNVLYFHDIMEYLTKREAPDLRIAVIDSDVLVTRSLQPLFALLDDHEFAGYIVSQTEPLEDVNGLSLRDMDRISRTFGADGPEIAQHFGGELFMTTCAAWERHRPLFSAMVEGATSRTGVAGEIITEEHVFSIAFAVLRGKVAQANHLLKRIWTSPRYSSVAPGDECLMLWHLPAEKRYGLRDVYTMLRKSRFPKSIDLNEFHPMAMKFCGVPRKGAAKVMHDGIRQLAAKFGLYQ